jgi:hypothetical protein
MLERVRGGESFSFSILGFFKNWKNRESAMKGKGSTFISKLVQPNQLPNGQKQANGSVMRT